MQGHIYTVTFAASVSAAQDAFEITPADDKPVELVGVCFNQYGVSDVGDAAEEMLRWSVIRGFTSSGSGGSAATPAAIKPGSPTVGFSAEINNTTLATTGTTATLHEDSFNVRAGTAFWWPEGSEPSANQGNTTIVVRLAAPADAVTLTGTLYVRELT